MPSCRCRARLIWHVRRSARSYAIQRGREGSPWESSTLGSLGWADSRCVLSASIRNPGAISPRVRRRRGGRGLCRRRQLHPNNRCWASGSLVSAKAGVESTVALRPSGALAWHDVISRSHRVPEVAAGNLVRGLFAGNGFGCRDISATDSMVVADWSRIYQWCCGRSNGLVSLGNIRSSFGRLTTAWSRRACRLVRRCHRGPRLKRHVRRHRWF